MIIPDVLTKNDFLSFVHWDKPKLPIIIDMCLSGYSSCITARMITFIYRVSLQLPSIHYLTYFFPEAQPDREDSRVYRSASCAVASSISPVGIVHAIPFLVEIRTPIETHVMSGYTRRIVHSTIAHSSSNPVILTTVYDYMSARSVGGWHRWSGWH